MNEEIVAKWQSWATWYARSYYRAAFERWPEDARQQVLLGVLQTPGDDKRSVRNSVAAAMRRLYQDLGYCQASLFALTRKSERRSEKFSCQRLRARGVSVAEIAARTGRSQAAIANATVNCLPPEVVRARRAAGGVKGGVKGATTRWGNWEGRHEVARTMRATGATLAKIQEACGYKSLSAAHYACRAERNQ
jgi:hypothetical protein